MERPGETPENLGAEGAKGPIVDREAALNTTDISDPLARFEKNKDREKYDGYDFLDTAMTRMEQKLSKLANTLRTMKSQTPEAKLQRDILMRATAEEIVMIEGGFLTQKEMRAGQHAGLLNERAYTDRVERLKQRAYELLREIDDLNFYEGYSTLEHSLEKYGYLDEFKQIEFDRKMVEDTSKKARGI